MSNFAWVTLATNDSYSLGALVVGYSLKRVATAHQLAVLITPGVTESMRTKLNSVFDVVQEVNVLDSQDTANLALLQRPELGITFTKLHCWNLTQFEKCVFLDADTLILQNCDELFEREELSAAPDVGWPDCFNTGVFVFRPNRDTFNKLIEFALKNGSFDGGDQGLLNQYYSDWAHKDISKHLPFIYNLSSTATYSYLPAFKQFGKDVKIIHFIGAVKPWLQRFDSQSRTVQPPEGFNHIGNYLQYWWNIFCEDVHVKLSPEMTGIAGALAKLTLGEPKTTEQDEYETLVRRQCWESGNIDYLGRDSFDNIWRRIQQTIDTNGSQNTNTNNDNINKIDANEPYRELTSRGKERSPTPQPDEKLAIDSTKKEVLFEPAIIEEELDEGPSSSNVTAAETTTQATVVSEEKTLPKESETPPLSPTGTAHYDPINNTTTITKKISNGYQQTIKTVLPEGQTKFETKIYLDPDTKDMDIDDDLIDTITEDTEVLQREQKKMERKNTPSKLTFKKSNSLETTLKSPVVTNATPPTSPPLLPPASPASPTITTGLKVDLDIPATPPAGTPPILSSAEPTKILRKKKMLVNLQQPTPPTSAATPLSKVAPPVAAKTEPLSATTPIGVKPTPPPRKKDPKKVVAKK